MLFPFGYIMAKEMLWLTDTGNPESNMEKFWSPSCFCPLPFVNTSFTNSLNDSYGEEENNKCMNECRNQTEDDCHEYLQDLVHKLAANAKHLKIVHFNVCGSKKKSGRITNPVKSLPFRRNRNALLKSHPKGQTRQTRRGLDDILSQVAENNPPTGLGRWKSGRDMFASKGWLKRHPNRNYIPATKPKQWILHSLSKITWKYLDKSLKCNIYFLEILKPIYYRTNVATHRTKEKRWKGYSNSSIWRTW